MNSITIPNYETDNIPQVNPAPKPILSEREYEVMYLIAKGLPTKSIANQLDIGVQTVHTYRYRIKEKLQLQSDVHIAMYAIRQGIIDVEQKV